MRPRTLTALAAVGLAVAAPVALAGQQSTTIGTRAKTCVLGPGADCRGVVHRWTVEHHGNLRKAKFTKADLRGADLRGADLRGADFRGAKLRHAEMRGANLKGARFGAAPKPWKRANQSLPPCGLFCEGADLAGAYLQNANLTNTSFFNANLTFATLNGANLTNARLDHADLSGATLIGANLTRADLRYATLGPVYNTPPTCYISFKAGCVVMGPSVSSLDANLAGVNLTCANLTGVLIEVLDPRTGRPVGSASADGPPMVGTPYMDTRGIVTNTAC